MTVVSACCEYVRIAFNVEMFAFMRAVGLVVGMHFGPTRPDS